MNFLSIFSLHYMNLPILMKNRNLYIVERRLIKCHLNMGMLDIIKGHPPRKNMKFDGFVAALYLPPSFIFWLTGWNFFTISIYPHLYKYIISLICFAIIDCSAISHRRWSPEMWDAVRSSFRAKHIYAMVCLSMIWWDNVSDVIIASH